MLCDCSYGSGEAFGKSFISRYLQIRRCVAIFGWAGRMAGFKFDLQEMSSAWVPLGTLQGGKAFLRSSDYSRCENPPSRILEGLQPCSSSEMLLVI